jgi:D-psicose/D-tagatose/L-ribulose 3-epimerase
VKLGANTWIWTSPLTDEGLAELAPRLRDWGFDIVELPVEQLGDWSPERAAEVLAAHGLGASIAVAMAPGRELCAADA